jgi:general secretion pathway protein E
MSHLQAPSFALADELTREFLLHHRVCPRGFHTDGRILVAIAEDALLEALDDIGSVYGREVMVELAPASEIERLIERVATRSEQSIELARADSYGNDTADVRDLANQPPVVRYVNLIVRDAYDARASDIHLEARREGLSARLRLDGVLVPATDPPAELQEAIVSRIKLLAELDIAERRRPQDGRIRVRLEDRELDIRVSTVPTIFGESVVLRLLDNGGRPAGLEQLGMTAQVLADMDALARKPYGLVLVTGPTGSGKTTTLYAALTRRDPLAEKIITVEDPVEYQLPGITQVPVHRQAGVTFGSALRSILRQDPDVVMIGEMRDNETAEIAIQAALTGHLVMATLHTNDAVSAIPRLLDLGVPGYLVQATVEAVLAQRLVRRICANCVTEYAADAEQRAVISESLRSSEELTLRRGSGCAACRGTGYSGRIGVFELLVMTDAIREAVTTGAAPAVVRSLASDAGMVTLASDAWQKVANGLTTVEEVVRVIQD